jgi:hypothetical protein
MLKNLIKHFMARREVYVNEADYIHDMGIRLAKGHVEEKNGLYVWREDSPESTLKEPKNDNH